MKMEVAILILLELTLQSTCGYCGEEFIKSRNPYFIGINSAIFNEVGELEDQNESQSLFYWN